MKGLVLFACFAVVLFSGCGHTPPAMQSSGSGSPPTVPPTAPPTAPPTVFPTGVTVSPASALVQPGGVLQFAATVFPAGANPAVTWSLTCLAADCGTIDTSGNYTAPATLPSPDVVFVGATSVVDTANGIAKAGIVSSEIELSPTSVAVAPDPSGKFGKFVYVANSGSDNVSMYKIDATTGVLQSIGTIAAGIFPMSVAVDPSGKFAYVANYDSGDISMYTIDATTGVLQSTGTISAVPGGGVGASPDSVVVHPSGNFAYVANTLEPWDGAGTSVSMYRINATTGALTSIGTIFEKLVNTANVAVHPSGNFAYVSTSGSISVYTVDANMGALTFIGSVAGQDPYYIAAHPSGKFAYVASWGSNIISMYTINPSTGALTSTGTVATGNTPEWVAIDPSGKFAYVANADSNDVWMYSIDTTTGSLVSIGQIAAGSGPYSIAIDPSGKFAYVANMNSNSISMYTVNSATGALTLIGSLAR